MRGILLRFTLRAKAEDKRAAALQVDALLPWAACPSATTGRLRLAVRREVEEPGRNRCYSEDLPAFGPGEGEVRAAGLAARK